MGMRMLAEEFHSQNLFADKIGFKWMRGKTGEK